MENIRLEQIREILRLTGQDNSLIDASMNLCKIDDLLSLLYKIRESLDKSIQLIEESQRKVDL